MHLIPLSKKCQLRDICSIKLYSFLSTLPTASSFMIQLFYHGDTDFGFIEYMYRMIALRGENSLHLWMLHFHLPIYRTI